MSGGVIDALLCAKNGRYNPAYAIRGFMYADLLDIK